MNPWAIAFDGIMTYNEKGNLPRLEAVYFVLNESDLLYVGQSSNIRGRIATHHRLAEFDARATHIAWIESGEKMTRRSLEKRMIAELAPELNGTLPTILETQEYGNNLCFRPPAELKAAIRQQMLDESRGSISNMLLTLVKRGLAVSTGISWTGSGAEAAELIIKHEGPDWEGRRE